VLDTKKSGRQSSLSSGAIGLPTRGLTLEERELLGRRFRAPGSRVLRALGILFGLGAVVLAVGYFAGAGFDPDVVSWEVLIVGVFSVVCVGVGSGMVRDSRAALTSAQVIDMSGPAVPAAGDPSGLSQFQIGGLNLQVPRGIVGGIVAGQSVRVCIALGLRPLPTRGTMSVLPNRGLLLSANGVPQPHLPQVFWRADVAGGTLWPIVSPGPVTPIAPPPISSPPRAGVLPAGPEASPSEAAFCDKCGQRNSSGFQFCRSCGARRTELGAPPRPG